MNYVVKFITYIMITLSSSQRQQFRLRTNYQGHAHEEKARQNSSQGAAAIKPLIGLPGCQNKN